MTDLVVRRLLIDLEAPFARHWAGGDAFRSAWLNALSQSFPIGEQFFIDAVREGLKSIPEPGRARLAAEVQGFIGQEATHRRIHELFNNQLTRQGDVNGIEPRVQRRIARMKGWDPRHAVAITAATEHFTAILAHWILGNREVLDGAEPRLQTMWLWHACEEAEHCSTAFDVYRAMDGSERWRRRWMRFVTFFFMTDVLRQTSRNLWRDGALFSWSTWRSAVRLMLGERGLVRRTWPLWRAYFRSDFHPSQHDPSPALEWLAANTAQFTVVSRPVR
jgi:predicted metal-dependent hydrolase